MSAGILRRAAALMRERAGNAGAHEVGYRWGADVRNDGRAWVGGGADAHALSFHGNPNTAEHVASWHPIVALAVADWLETSAYNYDVTPDLPSRKAALAAARAYLGEAA